MFAYPPYEPFLSGCRFLMTIAKDKLHTIPEEHADMTATLKHFK
jgi:hypothetical protein